MTAAAVGERYRFRVRLRWLAWDCWLRASPDLAKSDPALTDKARFRGLCLFCALNVSTLGASLTASLFGEEPSSGNVIRHTSTRDLSARSDVVIEIDPDTGDRGAHAVLSGTGTAYVASARNTRSGIAFRSREEAK